MATFLHASGEQPRSADIVILGGGPAGAAAMWAISRAAPDLKLILIERTSALGAGSSRASLECFRSCWPTACIAEQMRFSIQVFRNADDYLGEGASAALSARQHGYLFCATDERHAATLKADVVHLHANGLTHIEYLHGDELRHRFPWLGERVIAGKYDPLAGWLDSNGLIHAYVRAAKGQVLLDVGETWIETASGAVTGVRTAAGTIAAPIVVIANGAAAIEAGRTAGVELPIVVRPRQSFTTAWRDPRIPADAPMIIAGPPFPHLHPEANQGAIFGWEYGWHSKAARPLNGSIRSNTARNALIDPVFPADAFKDPRFPSITLAVLARQFGHRDGEGFADSRYLRGIRHNTGYYVYRGDEAAYRQPEDGAARIPYESERAIIDSHPAVRGLFLSVAHSGHGVMTSPAAGDLLASKVLGQPLRHPRYADFSLDVAWVPHDDNAL